jgi:hypothetical protein
MSIPATVSVAGCIFNDETDGSGRGSTGQASSNTSTTSGTDREASESTVFDIRDFGANVDGQTDDTEAVRAAVDAASNGGTVYFPQGTTLVSGVETPGPTPAIQLTDEHSGITLRGEGRSSVLKMDGGHTENNQVIYIDGNTGASDITVRDIRIDGNRANNAPRTTQGFLAWPTGDTENILVENVLIEQCSATAFKLNTAGLRVNYCTARYNTMHGFNPSSSDPNLPIEITNVLSHHNENHGIDDSCGDSYIDRFVVHDCTYGIKNTLETKRTTIKNGIIRNCDTVGYRMNIPDEDWPETPAKVVLDNILSEGHGDWAFRFDENSKFDVGTIVARNSNANGEVSAQIGFLKDCSVKAQRIVSYNSVSGAGLYYNSNKESNIQTYSHAGNPGGRVVGPALDRLSIAKDTVLTVGSDVVGSQNESSVLDTFIETLPRVKDVGAR